MANSHKVGLVFAIMLGGLHVVWTLLVLLGWAAPLVSFGLWAHMVQVTPAIAPFSVTAAITVIVVASLIGYVVGRIATLVWNKVHSH